MAEKREPQLCIRKKYFMAFFVKRFYSLRISETGKDIFDGKKEKAERNPLLKRRQSLTEESGKTPAAATGTRKTEKQGREDQWTRLRLRAADS